MKEEERKARDVIENLEVIKGCDVADLGKDRFIKDFNSCFGDEAKMTRYDEIRVEIQIGTIVMRFPFNPLPKTFIAYSKPDKIIV